MNVLSSLTSTFSRSTHTLTSSRSSYGNLSSHTVPPTASCLPVPALTTNICQISTSMPTSYWLGRSQALHDRFRSDYLDPSFLGSPKLRTRIRRMWLSAALKGRKDRRDLSGEAINV